MALIRVEQLAPFPFDLVCRELRRYPNAEIMWCALLPRLPQLFIMCSQHTECRGYSSGCHSRHSTSAFDRPCCRQHWSRCDGSDSLAIQRWSLPHYRLQLTC